MRLRLHISCAALVISLNCLYSQEQLPGRVINMIEDIIVLSAGDRDAEDFMEEISLLAENPVRINSGDENEIKRLFFLSPFQVQSVLEYTKKHGPLLSVNELKYIHGFDKELAGLLNHFIIVDREKQTFTGRHRQLRTITNFITDTREPEAGYPGKDYKILTKLRFTGGAVEANLTLEKDRGEVFILPSYQPEYCSGNITCNNNGLLNKIIIGDYRVRFGQGLTSWNGFSPSPSPAESRIMKSRSVILPHTSSDENDFFRGLALSFDMGKIKVMTFASDIMKDATVDNDPETGNPFIRSFYTSGLHNTVTGLQKRNKFKESTLGFNVNSMTRNLYLGMSGVYSILSLPVDPGDELRDIYDFRGTKNACLALEYACLLRYSYFFGELAINESGRTAFLQGLSLNPDGRI
ncbi:MAG: hypothetical protein KFF49_01805, partial [Bacteroidales bacterium]|nr:hypothetical protein [Bacteroidales bacterium]